MKYFWVIIGISIFPLYTEAVVPEFQQQIRAIVACNDGIDNDGDGLIDFASDPDCISWEDTNESTELPLEPVPIPEPKPIPEAQPKPLPKPIPQPISDPGTDTPSSPDYIESEPIQYILDSSNPEAVPIKQADSYEDRVWLDNIFSLIMIGVLSFGLWIWDMFLNTVPK